MTLEEIGALLSITRERVRQIKEKALQPAAAREPGAGVGELSRLSRRVGESGNRRAHR